MAELLDEFVPNENNCPNVRYIIDSGVLTFQQSLQTKLKALTHMDLSNCKVSALPEALCDLTALQYFEASNNQLTCLPSSIGNLKSLSKLVLPHNKLTMLPLSFSELSALEFLNVSHNEMKSIPTCFQSGTVQINYLDMSHNQIEEWTIGPMCGHALKYLNCSNNCLKANPSWIWGDFCHSLEELDLSYNQFSNASEVVKTYTLWRTGVTVRLKKLNLDHCGISTPHINLLHQLKVLERLNIGNTKDKSVNAKRKECSSSNFIWSISFKPFECKGVLTELYLCGLGLAALPDDINCLEVLEILNCNENRLQWLPDSLCHLSKLKVAVFSNNMLLYLPDEFGKLSSLEELLLDCNQIGELPSSCSNLVRLKWLDLYKNQLESLPCFLDACINNLSGLDIEFNYFDPLSSAEIFQNLYSSLKDKLHNHLHVGSNEESIRLSGFQKPDEYCDNSSDSGNSGSDEINDCESIASDNNLDDDTLRESPTSNVSNNENDEDWDLDEGQDDYFDPTVKIQRTYVPIPARALFIHEIVLHPGSFLPSDIHPSPSIRANNKDPFLPDEGQFEDA